jgi:gluconate 2-dehydrogenase gamma chain
MNRRDVLWALALAPLPAALGWSPATVERAARALRRAAATGGYQPQFFTPAEWETVRVLADLVIPRDERSGGATDAGVPEFMDFMLHETPAQQTPIRGGLAWLDREARERGGRPFRDLASAEQTALLDDIAWPARARPALSQGVAFFTQFRDMVAAGFWSSRLGVEDLGYRGNTFVAEWTGCPVEQLARLGLHPEE